MRPFTLHTANGRPFGLDDLRGRITLLATGYTSCPDVCPTTLAMLRDAVEKWQSEFGSVTAPEASRRIQVAFLSVDPARDSPATLTAYMKLFDERFIGLTGAGAEIDVLGRQIGLYYARQPAREDGWYMVDHTSSVAVIDDQAQLVALLPMPHGAGRIATVIEHYAGRKP